MGTIKQVVRKLINRHGSTDPFKIAGQRGILLQFSTLKNVLGYHQTYKRISVICIHSGLSEVEQRFVCAHELGHAVLHPKVNTPFLRRTTFFSIDRIEKEANEFAVELLVPDDCFQDLHEHSSLTADHISVRYGVPHELVRLKRIL